jgi:hypothetical protein
LTGRKNNTGVMPLKIDHLNRDAIKEKKLKLRDFLFLHKPYRLQSQSSQHVPRRAKAESGRAKAEAEYVRSDRENR